VSAAGLDTAPDAIGLFTFFRMQPVCFHIHIVVENINAAGRKSKGNEADDEMKYFYRY